jgi:hypothetical protein
MKQSAVGWIIDQLFELRNPTLNQIEIVKKAREMEKQQQGYTEDELFKIINDFCFDWNYNYKGELSQKQYLIEWFEKFKNK